MEGWLRSLTAMGFAALLGVGGAERASASTITVVMTGTWTSVTDTAGVLDGSIKAGTAFTATFVFDDGAPDVNALPDVGDYFLNGSAGTLSFSSGSYSFVDQGVSSNGVTIENDTNGVDVVGLFFDRFVASGPLPAGVALSSLAYGNPTLIDYTAGALTTDDLTGVDWDASLYDANFYFFGPIAGRAPTDYIEFDGIISGMTVSLPEPLALALLAVGALGVALRRRFA